MNNYVKYNYLHNNILREIVRIFCGEYGPRSYENYRIECGERIRIWVSEYSIKYGVNYDYLMLYLVENGIIESYVNLLGGDMDMFFINRQKNEHLH